MRVTLEAITQPKIAGIANAEEFVAYAARVSNPANQFNNETSANLLKYLIRHKHWSPFEMVHVVMKIETTRDIARQILRHRSFSFQEFSQRYARADQLGYTLSEARLQDTKNRQNSIQSDDIVLKEEWIAAQDDVMQHALVVYQEFLDKGLAKEVARKVLPEGLTNSVLYMAGTLRSWIHYIQSRIDISTQKEHRDIAVLAMPQIAKEFPSISELIKEQQNGG